MEKIKICTPLEKWVDIKSFDVENIDNIEIQININSNVKCIHCDTRDFHIISNIAPHDRGLKDRIKYPDSVIKDTEVFKFLKNLYDKLGGESEWQMVRNPNEPPRSESWRYKYIRFYRITNDEFIVTDNYENPIDYRNLLKNAIVHNKY